MEAMTTAGDTPPRNFPSACGEKPHGGRVLSGIKLTCQSERNVRVGAYYVLAYASTGDHYASVVFMGSVRNDVDSLCQGLVQFCGPFHLYLNHPRKTEATSS
jgi:hypothetical protein